MDTPVPSAGFNPGFPRGATEPRQRDLRHNTGGQVRSASTPFMTGFPVCSNTQMNYSTIQPLNEL